MRLLDIQLDQDSAEETLKLVERVAQHSPEQSRPEFGEEKMVRSWNRWTLKIKTWLDELEGIEIVIDKTEEFVG